MLSRSVSHIRQPLSLMEMRNHDGRMNVYITGGDLEQPARIFNKMIPGAHAYDISQMNGMDYLLVNYRILGEGPVRKRLQRARQERRKGEDEYACGPPCIAEAPPIRILG